jgi:hypothetical protein
VTIIYIIAGAIVAIMALLFGLALCRAARMGDEAQERFLQEQQKREEAEWRYADLVETVSHRTDQAAHRRHEDAKDWEGRL